MWTCLGHFVLFILFAVFSGGYCGQAGGKGAEMREKAGMAWFT